MKNSTLKVNTYGQSLWYDNIRRGIIESADLQKLIDNSGVLGVTSNPTIFDKAIAGSKDYDEVLRRLLADNPQVDIKALYEAIVIDDIGNAADTLRPIFDETERVDGYVSIEVSPILAHDTQGTIEEAERLFITIGRPNIMIKVPATEAGLPAIKTLIGKGINVNVTLMFSLQDFLDVSDAYLTGLEELAEKGGDMSKVASVASFFISGIDSVIDQELPDDSQLKGRIAIANAKMAYQKFQRVYQSDRFLALKAKGARVQRLLWASTGTKNPAYRDVLYVEELIGPDTVNTVPPVTLDAFRDHGKVRQSLTENVEDAYQRLM